MKEKFQNLKKDLRFRSAATKKQIKVTGGGPYNPPDTQTDTDATLLDIIGKETVSGLENTFDDD